MPDLDVIARRLQQFKTRLPLIVGNEIVSFALDNFDKQGFHDVGIKRWSDRKDPDPGRSILIGKQGGRGRRSIRILRRSAKQVEAGTDLDYMNLHNTGGKVSVRLTAKSRKFFWAMYHKTGQSKWKAMALTKKKTLTFTMPQRQFIGESQELDKRIKKVIEKQLEKIHR